MPYFGSWPEWMSLYLQSCANNPSIDWIFLTDCKTPALAPKNTRFIPVSWKDCAQLVHDICELSYLPDAPYKLCDFRFGFGEIFKTYLTGYDFLGFGDIDVIYGDLRSFLGKEVLRHDLLTFNATHVSGHLTLLRNTADITSKYKLYEPWLAQANNRAPAFLDENIGYYGITNVYSIESYNTPMSPYIKWTNGEFKFPYTWYYRRGKLFNNLDGDRDFMYLHFMRYKFIWSAKKIDRVVHFDLCAPPLEWCLEPDGFRLCTEDDRNPVRESFLPSYDPVQVVPSA